MIITSNDVKTARENMDRERNRYYMIASKAKGKSGLADRMQPAIDWKELFKKWGYEPCKS